MSGKMTRRDALKTTGLTLGGLALGGLAGSGAGMPAGRGQILNGPRNRNSLFDALPPFFPDREVLAPNAMRITFLGSWFSPRIAQEANSVFVEVGNALGEADQFVFDCGSGVQSKYNACGIGFARMDKIFLTHLHGDHMSDLTHIYCFGPSLDRKSPLYVWGPGNSRFVNRKDPAGNPYGNYADGTAAYCQLLREVARWHTESFGFQSTAFTDTYIDNRGLRPVWTCPDATPGAPPADRKDAYDLIPFEIDWETEGGTAYYNPASGVTITHFPAVHARQGSISYRLSWNGLSMVFSGDTKPNNYMLRQASGVDVLIHEMCLPPDLWTEKIAGIPSTSPLYNRALADSERVIDSSHTVQKAFGYLMSQLAKPPRLAVATHFPATDDTIFPALADIRLWYRRGEVAIADDLLVINVTRQRIRQRRAVVTDYAWPPEVPKEVMLGSYETPKYWAYETNDKGQVVQVGDPYAQLDPDADIVEGDPWDERP